MKFTNISKFIIKFMGGGKINFPFNHLKEVEINGDNDGEGGGGEDSGEFDLDTFKQDIVDIYNKFADTPITTDNVIIPDAFIMNKNLSYDETPQAPDFVDTDLTQFLASFCCNVPNVVPLYLKDSFDNRNLYFGRKGDSYTLAFYDGFDGQQTFDNIPDGLYNGDLDLSNYVSLSNDGIH